VKSIAMTVLEMARLTPDTTAHGFCWNKSGDTSERTFTVRNTRSDRGTMTMGNVAIPGPTAMYPYRNPGNYAIVSNGCNGARMSWGDSCQFRVRFTASGPSAQAPSPLLYQVPYWPSEITLASTTDPMASMKIAVRGSLNLNHCYDLPKLIVVNPRPNFGF
jgi:hypothetical protein